jgi:hypothetical protein
MINAAISLWLCDPDQNCLEKAEAWRRILLKDYADGQDGFFYSSATGDDLILRARHEFDDAMPSATGQVLEGLFRLSLVNGDAGLSLSSARSAAAAWGRVNNTPMAASGIVNAIDTIIHAKKLVLKNPSRDMLDVARSHPDPGRLDIVVPADAAMDHLLPADISAEAPGAYFCKGPVCLPPIRTAEELDGILASSD